MVDGGGIPLWSDMSQQVFLQTQNYAYDFEHKFFYFPELNNKSKPVAGADAIDVRSNTVKLEEFICLPPPIGLKLKKTHSFAKLIELKLNDTGGRTLERLPKAEKLKVVYFPASLLKIGTFNIVPKNEADLVAKCYYAKQTLVWEILENGMKNKIEVKWQNILAMRAIIQENSPGILEIELDKQPKFYHETNPDPRKHTTWELSQDFTAGQALTYRRHYLEFPSGVLDKHYEQLIHCDNHLLQLSQRPFPSLSSPYFDSNLVLSSPYFDSHLVHHPATDSSYGYDLHGLQTNPASHQQPALVVSTQQAEQFGNAMPSSLIYSTSPTLDIGSPHFKVINNGRLEDPMLAFPSQGLDDYANILLTDDDSMPCASNVERQPSRPDYENSSASANMWLTDSNVEFTSASTFFGLSLMELDQACHITYTGTETDYLPDPSVNSGDALTYGWEEHYSAMHGDLSDEDRLVLYTQGTHYIPPLQVSNQNLEIHLPDTLHPHVSPTWSTRVHDSPDCRG